MRTVCIQSNGLRIEIAECFAVQMALDILAISKTNIEVGRQQWPVSVSMKDVEESESSRGGNRRLEKH